MKLKFGVFLTAVILMTTGRVWALSDENRPEYQKEFDAYLRDLDAISQTGKALKNPSLEADLAKMNSDEKILLTAPSKNESKVQFAQNKAEIMNSVEAIRVPEEFRQEYADVYKEENQTISAQSLVDVQREVHKKISLDNSALKVAAHINPFRFLKEIPLTPAPREYNTIELPLNPMVGAYFNQFGRPYVAGSTDETAPVNFQQKSDKKGASGSFLQDLSLKNSMFVD